MKGIKFKSYILLTAALLAGSCKKFDDVNTDQFSATGEQVQIEYFINSSIVDAQMNPEVAERAFVLYWKTAGHQHSSSTFALGNYDDGWTSAYYNQVSGWLNAANTAVSIAAEKKAAGLERPFDNNLVQVARIWRAYLMSEMSDNFGPIPLNGFQGKNPDFSDVKTVYAFVLAELKDATAKLNPTIANAPGIDRQDPAYAYNYTKWKKYGNSLRMRLAMRLSEVDQQTAKSEFEAAAQSLNDIITKTDETFQVQEVDGWNSLTGVMSRSWNTQPISATLNNLYTGLGGIKSQDQVAADMQANIKPADWMGQRFEEHFSTLTNDPSAGYWFNGLPYAIDPRAYKTFIIPGDITNPNFTNSGSAAVTTKRSLVNSDGAAEKDIEAKYTWNARTAGSWGAKGVRSNPLLTFEGTMPRLGNQFRTSRNKRVFFAPWETYFLIAEAAERGWTVPMDGKSAYQEGIKSSFEYWGVLQHLSAYLASQDYNKVGTSVSWDHTTEPPATITKRFQNGYTGAEGAMTYTYPKNDLYKNGTVKNDHLTKIITQKFIAQTPWLPLEAWSDQRRLGLPFFENPVIETPAQTMPGLTPTTYMTSKVSFFPQRLRYPSGLSANNQAGYNQAVAALGGADGTLTPLYWAKKQ